MDLTPKETVSHFLQGHISVLFGLLLTYNPEDLSILDELPGTSRTNKLDTLIDKIKQFSTIYYSSVTARLGHVGNTALGNFDDPDTSPDKLSNDRGADITKEVIASLSGLRRRLQ